MGNLPNWKSSVEDFTPRIISMEIIRPHPSAPRLDRIAVTDDDVLGAADQQMKATAAHLKFKAVKSNPQINFPARASDHAACPSGARCKEAIQPAVRVGDTNRVMHCHADSLAELG
jgi:hypothetical protein